MKPPSGTAVPPSKATPTLSTTSGPCTLPAKASLRTTPKPARWYRLAAEQGDANAQRNLMYLEGHQDIPQGNAEAAVPTETVQPESGLGTSWLGIGVSIAIGVALIMGHNRAALKFS